MSNNIKYTGQIKGFPLIKIKSKEIIEKIQAGSFYMSSLEAYRRIYIDCTDNVIGDPYEGKLIVPKGTRIEIPELNVSEVIKDGVLSTAHENDFVFCMFGVNPRIHSSFAFDEEQKEKLIGFDNSALLITDVDEFIIRVEKAALNNKLKITHKFVKYYDPINCDINRFINLMNGLENIVFHKVKDYAYQQEYRFTIPNTNKADYLEFNIGDISDISKVFTTKEILTSIAVAK